MSEILSEKSFRVSETKWGVGVSAGLCHRSVTVWRDFCT
jgi:hypothetical protein